MNMTQKFAVSFVAIAALGSGLFTSTSADSMKSTRSATLAAMQSGEPAVVALNSKETPASQLNDLQYN